MAEARAMTTRLTPSSPLNRISLSLSTLEKLQQHWGRCAPFPARAVPSPGAGPLNPTLHHALFHGMD